MVSLAGILQRPAPSYGEHRAAHDNQRDRVQKYAAEETDGAGAQNDGNDQGASAGGQEQSDESASREDWWAWLGHTENTNRIIAVFTVVVAFAALVQASIYGGQLWHSYTTERPIVLVKIEDGDIVKAWLEGGPPRDDQLLRILWSATNYGRTPGWLTSSSINFKEVPERPRPPRRPTYERFMPANRFPLPPNGKDAHRQQTEAFFSPASQRAIVSGRSSLRFFGVLYYRGPFGWRHKTRFCWMWIGREGRPEDPDFRVIQFTTGGPRRWN